MARHTIVPHEEWISARKALLEREKAFTRERDELSRLRRELPWEKVGKACVFDGPDGKETLADLFGAPEPAHRLPRGGRSWSGPCGGRAGRVRRVGGRTGGYAGAVSARSRAGRRRFPESNPACRGYPSRRRSGGADSMLGAGRYCGATAVEPAVHTRPVGGVRFVVGPVSARLRRLVEPGNRFRFVRRPGVPWGAVGGPGRAGLVRAGSSRRAAYRRLRGGRAGERNSVIGEIAGSGLTRCAGDVDRWQRAARGRQPSRVEPCGVYPSRRMHSRGARPKSCEPPSGRARGSGLIYVLPHCIVTKATCCTGWLEKTDIIEIQTEPEPRAAREA